MARIRSVHPGLWTDDAFLGLSKDALLFVIALWSECDDGGAFQWKPRQLRPRLAAATADIDVDNILAELVEANFITRYRVDDADYGAVRSFGKYQKPQKPARLWPMPQRIREYTHTTSLPGREAEETVLGGGSNGSGNGHSGAKEPSGNGAREVRARPDADNGTLPEECGTGTVAVPDEDRTDTVPVASGEGEEKEEKRRGEEVPPLPPKGGVGGGRSRASRENPEFAEFYAAYPRKEAPDDALKAYRAVIREGATHAAIMAGVRRYKFSSDPTKRPFPATWLRGGRWKSQEHTEPACVASGDHRSAQNTKSKLGWLFRDGVNDPPDDDGCVIDGSATEVPAHGGMLN